MTHIDAEGGIRFANTEWVAAFIDESGMQQASRVQTREAGGSKLFLPAAQMGSLAIRGWQPTPDLLVGQEDAGEDNQDPSLRIGYAQRFGLGPARLRDAHRWRQAKIVEATEHLRALLALASRVQRLERGLLGLAQELAEGVRSREQAAARAWLE